MHAKRSAHCSSSRECSCNGSRPTEHLQRFNQGTPKGKQPDPALQLIESRQSQRLTPNGTTYIAIISAFAQGGQPERALQLFELVRAQGLVPNVITQCVNQCTREGHAARAGDAVLQIEPVAKAHA